MNLIFDKTLNRASLETTLAKNGARLTAKSAGVIIYQFASGARAEVMSAVNGQFRLRVLAPPGCACMK